MDGPAPEGVRLFHDHFVATDWENRSVAAGLAVTADEPFLVLFASGTTGEATGVLHSPNTVHAAVRGYVDAYGLDETWIAAVSAPLVHYSGFGPVTTTRPADPEDRAAQSNGVLIESKGIEVPARSTNSEPTLPGGPVTTSIRLTVRRPSPPVATAVTL